MSTYFKPHAASTGAQPVFPDVAVDTHPPTFMSEYTCCVAGRPQCLPHFSLHTASSAALPIFPDAHVNIHTHLYSWVHLMHGGMTQCPPISVYALVRLLHCLWCQMPLSTPSTCIYIWVHLLFTLNTKHIFTLNTHMFTVNTHVFAFKPHIYCKHLQIFTVNTQMYTVNTHTFAVKPRCLWQTSKNFLSTTNIL